MCRSVPQIPQRSTLINTSDAPHSGTGTSRNSNCFGATSTAAFMTFSLKIKREDDMAHPPWRTVAVMLAALSRTGQFVTDLRWVCSQALLRGRRILQDQLAALQFGPERRWNVSPEGLQVVFQLCHRTHAGDVGRDRGMDENELQCRRFERH